MDLFTAGPNNNNSTGVSYKTGFFMTIGLALLGLVFSSMLLGLLLKGDMQALKNPANANLLRVAQVFSVIISMFLPAYIVARMLDKQPFTLLGYRKQVYGNQVLLTLTIAFVSIFVAASFGYINRSIPVPAEWVQYLRKMEVDYADQVAVMVDLKSIGGYTMSLILLAFLPAVCEETLFRGGLQNFLSRATGKPWVAILVVSILFSLVHSSFYGFLPRMFLGMVLGLIYYYSHNIWLSILAHFFNNALAVTSLYALAREGKSIREAMNSDMSGGYLGLIAIPVLVLLFRSLRKSSDYRIEP